MEPTEPLQVNMPRPTKRGLRELAYIRQQAGCNDLTTMTDIVVAVVDAFLDGCLESNMGRVPTDVFGSVFSRLYDRVRVDNVSRQTFGGNDDADSPQV